jgi:hypothetical protein
MRELGFDRAEAMAIVRHESERASGQERES